MILGTDHYWRDWTIPDGMVFSPPDWKVAIANGSRFTFLKAADGIDKSTYFPEAYQSAKEAGLLVGAYVWLDARNFADPKRQAENWASVLRGLDCPMSIDFEEYKDNIPDWHDLWDAAYYFKQLDPTRRIGIYTNYWYYMAHGTPDPSMSDLLTFNWAARYYHEPPQLYPPWNRTDIWQFSGSGDPAKYGITNGKLAVDENYWMGDEQSLIDFFGGTPIPPDPPGETMIAHNPSALNLRDAPSTGNIIMQMPANTHIEGNEIVKAADGGLWLHTTVPQVGYCASWLLVYETTPPPVTGLPTINLHFDATGYPPFEGTWKPL